MIRPVICRGCSRSCACKPEPDYREGNLTCGSRCPFIVLDLVAPGSPHGSGVCKECATLLSLNAVLIDTVGTDAMDDVSGSIFHYFEQRRAA